MLHGFRRFQAEGKPEDGIRSRGRETVWTPFSPRPGTGGREAGQCGKRAEFLTGNALVAFSGTQFVTILSPRAFVRVENGAFPAGFPPHNLMNERRLCDGARRGIRTPDQLCVRQLVGRRDMVRLGFPWAAGGFSREALGGVRLRGAAFSFVVPWHVVGFRDMRPDGGLR